jgi:hypothetical protein
MPVGAFWVCADTQIVTRSVSAMQAKTVTGKAVREERITIGASELDVPSGSASSPIAKFQYRLCAPLRWWQDSIARLLVEEVCNFPRRIRAVVKQPSLRHGLQLLPHPWGCDLGNFSQENRCLHSCTDDILRLSHENRWVGHLDQQIAVQSYLRGATWALCNLCSGERNVQS